MRRRALLTSLGSIGSIALAGCIADDSPGAGDPNTTDPSTTTDDPSDGTPTDGGTATDDGTTTDDPSNRFEPAESEERERIEVGSREDVAFPDNNEPVHVHVWNDDDSEREFGVEVSAGSGSQRDLGTHALPADAHLTVVLNVPAEYTLAVTRDSQAVHELSLDHGNFDCNDGFTAIEVREDGSVDVSGITTEIACAGPTNRSGGMGVGQGECTNRETDEARIDYYDTNVGAEGTVVTPNPCYELDLATSEYDAESDTFRVVVEATEATDVDEGCQECVGQLDYTLSFGFEGDMPAHVILSHRVGDEETEVARKTWNEDVELAAN